MWKGNSALSKVRRKSRLAADKECCTGPRQSSKHYTLSCNTIPIFGFRIHPRYNFHHKLPRQILVNPKTPDCQPNKNANWNATGQVAMTAGSLKCQPVRELALSLPALRQAKRGKRCTLAVIKGFLVGRSSDKSCDLLLMRKCLFLVENVATKVRMGKKKWSISMR